MLSEKSRPVVEATLALVGSRIGDITPKFYERMFTAHPELLDGLFSRANQRNGVQQKALAGSIATFASWLLEHPDSLPEQVLSRIAHKHVSLGIVPEQYPIVYEHLFAAIVDDLGDAVTPEVADAWTEVYWLMAHALMSIEKGLYAQHASGAAWALWRVVEKRPAGAGARTFVLEPADDTPVTPARAGQYVSVRVALPDGLLQVRQYSLSAEIGATRRVFTTKLDDGGEVSPVLHRDVQVGDVVELSNPCGDVTLDDGDHPIVLATAGIGCTPAASFLRTLVEAGSSRRVIVLHAERELSQWALREQMLADVDDLHDANLRLWLEEPAPGAHEGFMSLADVPIPAGASVYLCGPLAFMKKIRGEALEAGVPAERIHYEVFGPDLWLAA